MHRVSLRSVLYRGWGAGVNGVVGWGLQGDNKQRFEKYYTLANIASSSILNLWQNLGQKQIIIKDPSCFNYDTNWMKLRIYLSLRSLLKRG